MESSDTKNHPMEHEGENCTSFDPLMANGHFGSGHHVKDHGNFMGHADPAMLSIAFGLLWAHNAIKRYQTARREAVLNGRDVSDLNFECSLFSLYGSGCCARAPVEAIVLAVLGIAAFFGELAYGFRDGIFVFANAHHMCMFFFFTLSGVTKILMHYKWPLPPRTDLAVFMVACVVEGLLFSGHVAGRTDMNAQAHMLLVYSIFATAMFCGLELVFPRSVLASLGRTISLVVHGQWFAMVGFILYPPVSFLPKWDQHDHNQMALVSSLFGAAIANALVGAFIMNQVIVCQVKHLSLSAVSRMQNLYYGKSRSSNPYGSPEKPLISDSDCEC